MSPARVRKGSCSESKQDLLSWIARTYGAVPGPATIPPVTERNRSSAQVPLDYLSDIELLRRRLEGHVAHRPVNWAPVERPVEFPEHPQEVEVGAGIPP